MAQRNAGRRRRADHHRQAQGQARDRQRPPKAACERCGMPQASAEPALLCKFTVLLARAPHDRHITKIKKAVTLSMSVCRGAVMVVVGPCEHRRERWKNPAPAESQAPWNVAIGGFSGENAARKQARRPAPPRSPPGLDARGGEDALFPLEERA